MATAPDPRCAEVSRALAEPMAGTAPTARRWLCLESPQPWPDDIARHPDPAVREFLARATAAGFRPLLTSGAEPGRIMLADTMPGSTSATTLTVRTEQLDALPLPEPGAPLPGEPVTGPLLLVCAHARRDPCCGLDGPALVEALADADVVACSHLGGHRFAPTALLLPTGYAYGHLDPAAAAELLAQARHGAVVVDRCRGRSTWSSRGQVAELAVRAATGLRSPADLVVVDDGDDPVQVATPSGERWAVDLETLEIDTTRPASCGARPTLMTPLRAVAVHALGHVAAG